jgi:lipid A disaccharide synthetase
MKQNKKDWLQKSLTASRKILALLPPSRHKAIKREAELRRYIVTIEDASKYGILK